MRKLVLFLQLLVVNFVSAQKEYPIPPITENRLFYIQHDGNHNTYVYDADFIKANLLNDLKPVTIYRIVYTEGGVKKKLTRIQETLAYGLDIKKINDNHYELSLVSYPNQKLYLRVNKNGKAYVETVINGKKMTLNRMFLLSNKQTSGLNNRLDCVLFYGKDISGKNISAKFIP